MTRLTAEWHRVDRIAALLVVGSLCVYLPTLFHDLFADDEIYLAFSNRMIRSTPWSDLYVFLLKPANAWEFLPLRDFSYWLDFRVYGDEPGGFHLTNLLWYALASFGAGFFFREILLFHSHRPIRHWSTLALCGVVVFSVHPAHVEAVAWVAGRKDLMAGTLCLICAAVLARGIRHGWRTRNVFYSATLFFCACFGKGTATGFVLFLTVLIVAGWDFAPRTSAVRKIGTLLLFWGVTAVAVFVHLRIAQATEIRIVNEPGLIVMIERASRILACLNGLLLMPVDLGLYHDVYALGHWHWLASVANLLLLALSIRAAIRQKALWGFGVVLAEAPLLVYLQFLPFTTWSLASERFLFVSVAGLALVLIDVFSRVHYPRWLVAALLFLSLPSAFIDFNRVAEWKHESTLWGREFERQPAFHNAIRDRIVYSLLPEKRYVEALELATTIKRDYATNALHALVNAERAHMNLRSATPRSSEPRDEFCAAVVVLKESLSVGYSLIPRERDISFANLLRSLESQLNYRYSDHKQICRG